MTELILTLDACVDQLSLDSLPLDLSRVTFLSTTELGGGGESGVAARPSGRPRRQHSRTSSYAYAELQKALPGENENKETTAKTAPQTEVIRGLEL